MMLEELKIQLSGLNNAISKIEQGAQSYTIGNRSLTRGSLSALYAERRKLQQEITALENGGGCYVGAFTRD